MMNHLHYLSHVFGITLRLRQSLLITIGLLFGFQSTQAILIGGNEWTVDTLDYYQAGPGVQYTKFTIRYASAVRTLYVLETDMTNPYNKIEEWQSQQEVGTFQLLTDAHQQMSYPNHRPIGSVNCNFWVGTPNIEVDPTLAGCDGQCLSATARNGWLIGEPMYNWNRGYPGDDPKQSVGFVMITKQKRAFIEDMWYDGYMLIRGERHAIRDCNRTRTSPNDNEIALFNEYLGSKRTRQTDGVEVVFTPHEWNINEDMHCTVLSKNTTGGTKLASGQGVLQGRGTGRTYLNTLQTGDTFTIHLDIFSQSDSIRPHIVQMITGNALVMKHGVLMPRNTTESYCSMDYPRSMFATNESGDRFWMMISEKPGMKTAELCDILKAMGATYAAGADGGGSAQMNLFGTIQNPTTESTPRRLPNSLFVVSTAPDNEEAGALAFLNPLTSLPAYASYTPTLRAWTREGALISHDYKHHQLSCEPKTLGTISVDGLTFTANPVNERGKLIATYGDARAETIIEVRDGEVRITLDSIVLGNRDYQIQTQAVAGDIILPLDPKALTWSVIAPAPQPCSVSGDGVLHGLTNGSAQVIGSLSAFSDTLAVKVELANAPRRSSAAHPEVITLPWDTTFAFASTRNASITILTPMRCYGNPDSILVHIRTTSPLQTVELTYHDAINGTNRKYKANGQQESSLISFSYPVDKMITDTTNHGVHPITLESMKCAIKDPVRNQSYTFSLVDIILCYRDWSHTSGLIDPSAAEQRTAGVTKVMVDGTIYIIKDDRVYTSEGHEVR